MHNVCSSLSISLTDACFARHTTSAINTLACISGPCLVPVLGLAPSPSVPSTCYTRTFACALTTEEVPVAQREHTGHPQEHNVRQNDEQTPPL